MEYAQLNEAGTEALQITTHGNVEWDANNYCSAEALTKDGKAEQFRVVPLKIIEQPTYDAITQRCFRDGCEKVNGQWQYKWSVQLLSPEEVAANQAAADKALYDSIVAATQDRLDTFAKDRGYDGILSACTYATSPSTNFATEGQYCVAQRDATWIKLIEILGEITFGTRPRPSGYADIEADLPPLVWPT